MRKHIDAAVPRRLIASQFPQWAHLPISPVEHDGWDNRTFRLGDELSIRLPSGEWYAKQVAKEQRWLPVLAPQLPLPIPAPVANGEPDDGFPYPWSVYRWLEGDIARAVTHRRPRSRSRADLAEFLARARGRRRHRRPGARASTTSSAAARSRTTSPRRSRRSRRSAPRSRATPSLRVWEDAMATTWDRDPVWFHGDVAVGNLLVRDGRLAAVLDFGTSGVGDPACDMAIAWTFFRGAARERFRADRDVDDATWARGRGWCLWKTLITLAGGDAPDEPALLREIDEIIG